MGDKNKFIEKDIEERNFDFKRFLFKYIKYWYVFVASVIVAFFIAKYYNWYVTPTYKSSCRIIIKDENANSSAENLLKELSASKRNANLENEIQILKSKSLISKAVEKLDLNVTYLLQGKIKSTELYNKCPFKINPDTLNELAYFIGINITILNQNSFQLAFKANENSSETSNTYLFGQKIKNELGEFTVDKRDFFDNKLYNDPDFEKKKFKIYFNPLENITSYYSSALGVDIVASGSSILELSVSGTVPEECSDFLNKLTEVYISNSSEQKNLLASNSIKFIDSQIESISGELKSIEKTMSEFQTSKGIINIDNESKSFLDRVKDYDEKISENKIQISFIDYIEKDIKENKKLNDISPTSLGINDPLLVKLISDLNELENEYNSRANDSKPNSPVLVDLDKKIKQNKLAILDNLNGVKQKFILTQKEINSNLHEIEAKLSSIPKTEIELIGIKRQFSIKEGLYLFLLQKRSETAILLASSVSDNWVIDKAVPSFNPIKPIRSKSYAIAIVLGLIFPILIISIIELLNDKITDKESLESNTKIPLMGIIGFNDDNTNLFTEKKPKPIIMEAFRSIRTNINYFLNENSDHKKQNVILITSSISTEGKTFISYNLAGIFASSEKKTVLLCLDLRKPKIIDGISLNRNIGVTNYLAGSSELKDVIQNVKELPHLDVILSGPTPPNPSELILKEKMDVLFNYLRDNYDYVIVDTPPIGLVADGIVLTKYSDVNIYVVRQNTTRKQHLQFINKLYNEKKITNLGIVFNSVKVNSSSYGYAYGYGYGYGYGEESDSKDKKSLSKLFSKKS